MISKFITRKNTNPQIGDIGFQNYTPSVFPVDNINTLPFNIDQTLSDENTNDIRFRDILFNDLRNLPQDFRTSLGQTKDALIKDFGGLTSGITSVLDKTKSGINLRIFIKCSPSPLKSAIPVI